MMIISNDDKRSVASPAPEASNMIPLEQEATSMEIVDDSCVRKMVAWGKFGMLIFKTVQENYFYLMLSTLYKIIVAAVNLKYGFGNSFALFFIINLVFLAGFGLVFLMVSTCVSVKNACGGEGCTIGKRTLTFAMIYGICGSILNLCLLPFYIQCEQKGYVWTDDYIYNNSTLGYDHIEHKLECTQFASWGTLAGVLMDIFLLLKGVLNIYGFRRTGLIIVLGIPILLFWSVPMAVDAVMCLLCCTCGKKSVFWDLCKWIDEKLMNAEEDWI